MATLEENSIDDLEPFDSLEEDAAIYQNQDLLNILTSLQDDEEDLQLSGLPEIEFHPDHDDDDPLLNPIENIESIFEQEDADDNNLKQPSSQLDQDLLQQLQNLNVDETYEPPDDDNESLPSYLYCQPCLDEDDYQIGTIEDLLNDMSLYEAQQDTPTPKIPPSAQPILKAFEATPRSCLGHKERILGSDIYDHYLATTGQDSTVRIWNLKNQKLVNTIDQFDSDFEVLRVAWASSTWGGSIRKEYPYLLASGGADGKVKLFGAQDPATKWTLLETIDHATFSHFVAQDTNDKPQTYALQFIDEYNAFGQEANNFLLTSSDDHMHLWEISHKKSKAESSTDTDNSRSPSKKSAPLDLREVMSLCFQDMHNEGVGVKVSNVTNGAVAERETDASGPHFGGPRNPMGLIYVFDAHYCSTNGLLGAALSDGSLRLLNGRGVCVRLLTLPGHQSHLTAFSWDASGHKLATCVASGQVITWSIDVANDCAAHACAVYDGGHAPGRPLFGALFDEEGGLMVSYGMDGRICLWDGSAKGDVSGPLSVLRNDSEYPLFALEWKSSYLVAAGGQDGGFLGVPVYIYDIDDESESAASKKHKKGE